MGGSYCSTLQLLFNNALSNSDFPENLKPVPATPVFKKKDLLEKTDCRPILVLFRVSKDF